MIILSTYMAGTNYITRSNVFSKIRGMFLPEPTKQEVNPQHISESYTAKAIRVLTENDFMCIKTGLRIAPHFKYQNEVVVKLHPKILRAANDLFNDDGVHDLTFMLVPISAKASELVAHIKDKP